MSESALDAPRGPVRLDPRSFAGFLWRGAPLRPVWEPRSQGAVAAGATPPADGAEPPATAADALAGLGAQTTAAGFAVLTHGGHASLALLAARRLCGGAECDAFTLRWPQHDESAIAEAGRMARALGARHHVVDVAPLDPVRELPSWLQSTRAPCLDAFEAFLVDQAFARVRASAATSAGGAALFTLGEPFKTLAARRLRLLDRSRPPRVLPEPFDLLGQRQMERESLRRVPVHAAQAALSLLPAATRAAITTTGQRPPDATRLASGRASAHAAALSMSEAALSAAIDRSAAAPSARTTRPFLDPAFVSIVRRLSPRVRFGRPGSGGLLQTWLRRAHGWADPRPVEGFVATLDGWLRGPLGHWLADALARDRLASQGVWRPEGVARAVELWRARADGWSARIVFTLALAALWIDRDGLDRAPPRERPAT